MGNVPSWIFCVLGWGSIVVGTLAIVIGTALLAAAAWKTPSATDADAGKLLEAISKLPQWAVAMIVGYMQVSIGFWMLGATLFGHKMLP